MCCSLLGKLPPDFAHSRGYDEELLEPGEVAGKHAVQGVVEVQQREELRHVLLAVEQRISDRLDLAAEDLAGRIRELEPLPLPCRRGLRPRQVAQELCEGLWLPQHVYQPCIQCLCLLQHRCNSESQIPIVAI